MKKIITTQDILSEVSWQTDSGIIDFSKPSHVTILERVLTSYGFPKQEIAKTIQNLTEADDDKFVHKGKGIYVKKGQENNPDAQRFEKTDDGKYREVEGDVESDGDNREYVKNMLATPEPGSDAAITKGEDDVQPDNIISGKNKTLKVGDPAKTKEFNRDLEPDSEAFNERNINSAIPEPPSKYVIPEEVLQNVKFPKRYANALQRMVNTKLTNDSKSWKHFSDIEGGAGQISAQAGELMTMMGSSLDDTQFEVFIASLEEHEKNQIASNPELKKESTRIVTKSWIKSARNTRKVIIDRVAKQYGSGAQVIGASWDAKSEVEALGLNDYETNKGFSTDMYLKVRKANGDELLDEISLKKDKNVNFLNSGIGTMVNSWDPSMKGSEIDPTTYSKNERTRLAAGAIKILPIDERERLQKNIELASKGKGSRKNSKAILLAIKAQADSGSDSAKQYLREDDMIHREMQTKAIEQINTNPKMREGLVNEIKTEFPLKAVSEGEETMAIGDMSLDRETMKDIFGTDKYDTLKENLTVKQSDKGEPYLAYTLNGEQEVKVSNIVIRQDGRGYGGGTIKFEMKLHPELAKRLKEATVKVYS